MPSRASRLAVPGTARFRLARLDRLALVLAAAAALGACAGGSSPAQSPSGASITPTTGAVGTSAPEASPPAQADTSWGRIWEGLPSTFPQVAGAEPTEVGGTGPTSATLDIPATSASALGVISFYRSALATEGYSVSVDGPLEDGGYTISATGSSGCAAQVTVTPLGSSTTVTVLYGAACPFE